MDQSIEQIRPEITTLHDSVQTLQMATLNHDNEACISYTPFLKLDSSYYIFVSRLASHTQNLLTNPALSILLIEDESKSRNIFARMRLSLTCQACEIEKDCKDGEAILNDFEARHGNTVKLLRTLPDFHLFKLEPVSGTFVKGFGQAFELSGDDLQNIERIKG